MMRVINIGLLLSAVLAKASWASSDAEHGINWWHLGPQYSDAPAVGWLILTFLVFVYGIARAIRKPLSLYLETRSKDIRHQIEEGQRAKEESEEKLRVYEEKLRSLGQEIEKLKNSFSIQANAEKTERERKALELEARILRDADDTIRASFERSKNRLASEVIDKAMALAEQIIKEEKRERVDEVLKESFIEDLKRTSEEGIKDVPAGNSAPLRQRAPALSPG